MENLHIQFEFSEAIDAKKGVLNSEINFIKIIKKIENYRELRRAELIKKAELRARINELVLRMKSLKAILPYSKSPELEKEDIQEKVIAATKNSTLESELKEIQDRLSKLNQ